MNRRGFLSAILAAGAAPAIVRAASLMSVWSIALPTTEEVLAVADGYPLLTIDMITREALRLVHEKASFLGTINRQFDDWSVGTTVKIRTPKRYTLNGP